jgi:hypothetical protein
MALAERSPKDLDGIFAQNPSPLPIRRKHPRRFGFSWYGWETTMNLLVCRNQREADRAASLLGLDPEEWKAWGLGHMIGGERFERIVVLHPIDATTRAYDLQWLAQDLPCKLPPGGKVEYIG